MLSVAACCVVVVVTTGWMSLKLAQTTARRTDAALVSTFVTSPAGVITFTILSIHQHAHIAPE
jgi:hypothetical protein